MHVLVTGASSGIGEAIAREFARSGAALTLIARRRDRLESLAAAAGVPSTIVAADLSDPQAALDALAQGEAAHGPVDVLVNNAGVQIVARTVDVDPAEAERLFDLNVTTPLRLVRAVLPAMIARGSGSIVNVSSLAALAPTPGMFHYNASKAALAAASESLGGELRGTGVHALTVYPGPVATDMAEKALQKYPGSVRLMPTGNVTTLARRIARAVRRRRRRIVYPLPYVAARWFPVTTRWVLDTFAPMPESGPGA